MISKAHRSLIRTTLYSCSALFCLGTAALADTNVNAASTANVQDETVAPTAIAQAVAPSDTVATPEATEEVDPYRLRRGLRERDFSVGYGKKIQISRFKERTKVTMYQLLPRWGRFKDDRQDDIDAFKKRLAMDREELRRKLAGPQTPKEWASRAKGAAAKAQKAADALDSEGRWIKGEEIDGGEFVKNLNAMTWYVEARKKSGL